MDAMSIRAILDRVLDSKFGAYPATRGVGHIAVPVKERGLVVEKHAKDAAWPKHDWVAAHNL